MCSFELNFERSSDINWFEIKLQRYHYYENYYSLQDLLHVKKTTINLQTNRECCYIWIIISKKFAYSITLLFLFFNLVHCQVCDKKTML